MAKRARKRSFGIGVEEAKGSSGGGAFLFGIDTRKQFEAAYITEIRAHVRYYIFDSLSVDTTGNPWLGPAGKTLGSEPRLPGRSADDECLHGRMAGDASPPCGCWPQEGHGPRIAPHWRRRAAL